MIVATGIDIVQIARIGELMSRRGERFRERVFTDGEVAYCEKRSLPVQSYAARFAAKEAAMKALGTGWAGGIGWRDIEVVSTESGAPYLQMHGQALKRCDEIGARTVHLSMSHSGDIAIAQVVLEG